MDLGCKEAAGAKAEALQNLIEVYFENSLVKSSQQKHWKHQLGVVFAKCLICEARPLRDNWAIPSTENTIKGLCIFCHLQLQHQF